MSSNTFLSAEVIGRLGGDAEVRTLPSGAYVMNFNVAHDPWAPEGQTRETVWVKVSVWGKLCDTMIDLAEQYNALAKGDQVFVRGEPNVSSWTTNNGEARATFELRAQEIKLLGNRKDNGS